MQDTITETDALIRSWLRGELPADQDTPAEVGDEVIVTRGARAWIGTLTFCQPNDTRPDWTAVALTLPGGRREHLMIDDRTQMYRAAV